MCFNEQVSLATWVIGATGCVGLWTRGHRAEAVFFFWVINMQLRRVGPVAVSVSGRPRAQPVDLPSRDVSQPDATDHPVAGGVVLL